MTPPEKSDFETALVIENLNLNFKGEPLFQNFNLQIHSGEILCLLGPSGCGKSTLLRLLAGLLGPDSGEILWNQKIQNSLKGFVFQDPQLLSWRTALENTRLPLELLNHTSAADQNTKARDAMQKVGLGNVTQSYPHELSGGMRMRLSLARALSVAPKVLLMDEPFAALDEPTRFRLQSELLKLAAQEKLTIVFVTHSIQEAAFLADRVLILQPTRPTAISFDTTVQYSKARSSHLREDPEYFDWIKVLSAQMLGFQS